MSNGSESGDAVTAPETPASAHPDDQADGDDPAVGRRGESRLHRRALFGGLASAGAAIAGGGWWLGARSISRRRTPEPPVAAERSNPQAAVAQPSAAGGFGSREESLVARNVPDLPEGDNEAQRVWATPAEAAENTEVEVPTILATDVPVVHLLRRTTFGPTPAAVMEAQSKGIDAWLEEQLDPGTIDDALAEDAWALYPLASMGPTEIRGEIENGDWEAMLEYSKATLTRQVWSNRQLFEVMADFWGDHLHVTTPSGQPWDSAPSYYNDVIREHALGSFTDMLLAAGRHPALLRYLDNDKSKKDSVNENLGRELLELHTVGIDGGYSEEDVRNSAYILTGRTVAEDDDSEDKGTFRYDAELHWTGPVKVLDFEHDNGTADGGLDVGDEYLRYLASHPATARTISRKLAVRFVSDSPPDELVDRLVEKYLESGSEIVPVLDLLFRSSEFWAAVGQKVKRPQENVVATCRILDIRPGEDTVDAVMELWNWASRAGQRPLAWSAPNGYPDVYPPWRSASGILQQWKTHRALVNGNEEGFTYHEPDSLAESRPGDPVGEHVDSLCRRLCLQTFQEEHRAALIIFVGSDETTAAEDAELDDLARKVAPLVLDSPYFALR